MLKRTRVKRANPNPFSDWFGPATIVDWFPGPDSCDIESGHEGSDELPRDGIIKTPGWDYVASMEFHTACVARPINKRELADLKAKKPKQYQKAMDAMNKEWNNLRTKGVWENDVVRNSCEISCCETRGPLTKYGSKPEWEHIGCQFYSSPTNPKRA